MSRALPCQIIAGAVSTVALASSSLALPALRVSDLRPGYVVAQNVNRTPSTIAKQEPLLAHLLLSHGWVAGYAAVFQRPENTRVQVGQIVDRFRAVSGAHWWYQASVLRVPPGYHAVSMPRVGDESTAVQNTAFIGIIFRRGVDVIDVYVSLVAPLARPSVHHFAELLAARAMPVQTVTPAASTHPASAVPLPVHVWVRQLVTGAGTKVTLYARSRAGARCTSTVTGSRHQGYVPFRGFVWIVGGDGVVSWTWLASPAAKRDTAVVTCTDGKASTTVRSTFSVRHRPKT